MKITIQKVTSVDVEVELLDFLNSRHCDFEYISHESHPSYSSWDGYPDTDFIMIYQEYDAGELYLSEIATLLCDKEPADLKAYCIEHINEIKQLDH